MGLAEACIQVENILGPTPPYPQSWLESKADNASELTAQDYPGSSSELYLSGRGYWQDTKAACNLNCRVLEKRLLVGVQKPCQFEFVENGPFQEWPGVERRSHPVEGNYIALFVLAWAYIFSAKWVELSKPNTDSQFAHREMKVYGRH